MSISLGDSKPLPSMSYRTRPTPWATQIRRVIVAALLTLIFVTLLVFASQPRIRVASTKTVTVHTARQASFWYWANKECPNYDPREVTPIIQKDNHGIRPGDITIGEKLRVPVCK